MRECNSNRPTSRVYLAKLWLALESIWIEHEHSLQVRRGSSAGPRAFGSKGCFCKIVVASLPTNKQNTIERPNDGPGAIIPDPHPPERCVCATLSVPLYLCVSASLRLRIQNPGLQNRTFAPISPRSKRRRCIDRFFLSDWCPEARWANATGAPHRNKSTWQSATCLRESQRR